MEQFDPETQKRFIHAPQIDPFAAPQAEYEHAQRVSRQVQNRFASGRARFSDLVANGRKNQRRVLLSTIRFLISIEVYHGKHLRNVPLLE